MEHGFPKGRFVDFRIPEEEIKEKASKTGLLSRSEVTGLERYYYPFVLVTGKVLVEREKGLVFKKEYTVPVSVQILFDGVKGGLILPGKKVRRTKPLLDLSKEEMIILGNLPSTLKEITSLGFGGRETKKVISGLIRKGLIQIKKKKIKDKKINVYAPRPGIKQPWSLGLPFKEVVRRGEGKRLRLSVSTERIRSFVRELYEASNLDTRLIYYPFYAVLLEKREVRIFDGYNGTENPELGKTIFRKELIDKGYVLRKK